MSEATTDPLDTFAREWRTVPPLVRAALAATVAVWAHGIAESQLLAAVVQERGGMDRRGRVSRDYAGALSMVQDLFARLAIVADADAIAAGIDVTATTSPNTLHRASADADQPLTNEPSAELRPYAPEVSQIVVERDLALGERDQARTALEAIVKALGVEEVGVHEVFGLAAVVDAATATHGTIERLTTLVGVLTAMLRDRAAPEIREATTRKNLLADLDVELRNAGVLPPTEPQSGNRGAQRGQQ